MASRFYLDKSGVPYSCSAIDEVQNLLQSIALKSCELLEHGDRQSFEDAIEYITECERQLEFVRQVNESLRIKLNVFLNEG